MKIKLTVDPPIGTITQSMVSCGYPKWMHEEGGLMDEPTDQPVVNIQVIECAVCHEELINALTHWRHRPDSSQTEDHRPEPQPRMGVPSGNETPTP